MSTTTATGTSEATMKALVQERYGPPDRVLELRDEPRPVAGQGQVLVRVRATTVAGDDWHLMRGLPYLARLEGGLLKPKRRIPGHDAAGVVEAVGAGVDRFRPGDEVFGWCASGGGFAEYVALPEEALALKPANLTFGQAAAVPISAFTALQAVRDRGEAGPGKTVLINGAAGGVGTFAVQIAKALGAEVTGVCSTRNIGMVRSIGADHVLDYTQEDFTAGGRRWDVIVDMVANRPLAACRRALTPDGILVMVGGRGGNIFMGTDRWLKAMLLGPFVRQKLRPLIHQNRHEDLLYLKELMEAGKLTPVIEREIGLDQVLEAIRGFESWHASGKVVVTP